MEKRGVKKRTKSPTVAELSRLKRELQRVTEQLESRERELSEVLEQQTATTEILRVIASSPTDLQPVLDVVAENAARLCEATDALIRRVEADILRLVASYGPLPTSQTRPISRQVVSGRAVIDRQTIHVHDIAVAEDEFPDTRTRGIPEGVRTFLATPLLCKGVPIGTIVIRRMEARPFSDKQIKLLETFADQAVIAIENVRLFQELQERNQDLTESLEQQTATGEVLRVIASSPTELQPVLDTVITNAVKLIGAEHGHIRQYDGELLQVVAYCNVGAEGVTALQERPVRPGRETAPGRAFLERKPIHIPNLELELELEAEYTPPPYRAGSILVVPMLREGAPIGTLSIWRESVMPFTERQIELVTTFADQAVIAIENVRLFQELQVRNRDLTEALEQQTATSEILRVIASSPTDLQPVLDTVAESAARLCNSDDAQIYRVETDVMRKVASYGNIRTERMVGEAQPITRGSATGRAILGAETVHIHDMMAEREEDWPEVWRIHQRLGIPTALAVPLLRQGIPIGAIMIRRTEVRPFTEKQIALLKTFADQAVIAIENVRLFKELQARNTELREALEHQTATAEVLGIISRSPTDVQPVLDAIVESAARVCGIDDLGLRLREGSNFVSRAHFGPLAVPVDREEVSIDDPRFRWIAEHGTLHIPDARAQNDFPWLGLVSGARTFLLVPLRQQGEVVGTLGARRMEVRPFTPVQIKLLETFANQAVIALENVRLFQELKEALDQQTATSEILGVIASSPTDIQPVLDAVAENAAKITGSDDAVIYRVHGDNLIRAAKYGPHEWGPLGEIGQRLSRGTPAGRAVIDRQVMHVPDLLAAPLEFPDVRRHIQYGSRTVLSTPLLREGVPIGVIHIRRTEVRPFTDKQIALLKTFADQAVIAIENVRLFKELQERNAELREALEHQTATSEILGVIASSPTDIQPVLDAVAQSAATLCEARDAVIYRVDGEVLQRVAICGPIPIRLTPLNLTRGTTAGRAVVDRQTIHIHDIDAVPETEFPDMDRAGTSGGSRARTRLAVPLLREGISIGAILIRRMEARPFSDKQIKLLETFARQAVIAIENVRLFQELKESLEQQTATSEILGVIASSPTDAQPVLDVIAENAARVCGSYDAVIRLLEGNVLRLAAHYGPVEPGFGLERPLGGAPGKAILERKTIQIPDIQAEVPDARNRNADVRTFLVTPLLREGTAIGVISIRRTEIKPFTDKQVALLETFASQAVIAIENVRLFKELQERNSELREALEHQTATAEVLGIISRSPTDVQPVLDAIVESAARVCGIDDVHLRLQAGNMMVSRAHFGPIPIARAEVSIDEPGVRWVREHGTHHIPDVQAENEVPSLRSGRDVRTFLSIPLRQAGDLVGLLNARRAEVRPFTPAQIKLLETFANQAVIALENVRLFQELKESLEQQTATSEILGVIASSPTDIQPVLDAVAEHAARLCEASDALILRFNGNSQERVASYGSMPVLEVTSNSTSRGTPAGRAIIDRKTIHVHDLTASESDFPDAQTRGIAMGVRTALVAPLLREGISIGAIYIRRKEVRPFSDRQIKLLETFAAQAVIAIENVRLFKEIQERNAELREALEHQTATSEVLGIISRSPTDVQPVLDAIVESAARVCGVDDVLLRLHEGNVTIPRAHVGSIPVVRIEVSTDEPQVRWISEHGTLHVPDVHTQNDFPMLGSASGYHTHLSVPLRQQGELIGMLTARRIEVHPFTPAQIKLLETFANQAVIALENVRLFQELKESLERQTATSEILGVIASSPTDVQPVLDVIAENAARVCGSYDAVIRLLEGNVLRLAAHYGPVEPGFGLERSLGGGAVGKAVLERKTVHIPDIQVEAEGFPDGAQSRVRTLLVTPLLREGTAIGVINIRRTEVRPFTDKQVALLETFASQAVIAIENVRLFHEIQERNAELREALEHQTATSEVLGIISRSPTDVQPVLDEIVASAVRVCGIDDVTLRLREGETMVVRAHSGPIPVPTERAVINIDDPRFSWMREHGSLHIPDVSQQNDFPIVNVSGSRTFLIVPLRQQGEILGTLSARRVEVRPFTPVQIKLLETFADQAVIAIENVRLFQELKESLEQQTATSEILGVIASSPTDIQPVLNVVAENAARLCEADDAIIRRLDGNVMPLVAHYGQIPPGGMDAPTVSPRDVVGRAIIGRQPIHLHDLAAAEVASEFPDSKFAQERSGARTFLTMPMLREGTPVGVINIRRQEVRPFSEKHIALLKTFADQAVIAIENVRLFKEIQERNAELREALEHQTATSEVLGIISRSPTDVQPVLDAIVESAARVCGVDDVGLRLREENALVAHAHFGSIPIARREISIGPQHHWMRERGALHIPDIRAQYEFPDVGSTGNFCTFLGAPLIQQGELIGVLNARRIEVRPFTPAQIKLLETFANQAVIALDNVRLFQELKEALEQQTATSEILGVIASSPTDIQPVLDAIAQSAARVCGSDDATIRLLDGDEYFLAAHFGAIPPPRRGRGSLQWRSVGNEALLQRRTIHIPDLQAEAERYPDSLHMGRGIRTFLVTPLLREGTAIGLISIRRTEVKPFSDKQVALLETFASQAVIAIENVRLFKELQERNRELTEALDQQTATSEVLDMIAHSPVELQPVYDAILGNTTRLCEANIAALFLYDGEVLNTAASYGTTHEFAEHLKRSRPRPSRGTTTRLAALELRTVHVPDLLSDPAFSPEPRELYEKENVRTVLSVPMLREDKLIGVITTWRREVRPFSDKQVALVKTFADQAVIAVENARLLQELQQRTRELVRSVEELKALGEVGQTVSSTLNLEAVLTRIVSHAVQLSGTDGGAIYEYDEQSEEFLLRVTDRMEEELIAALRANPPRLGDGVVGRAASGREPIQIPNIAEAHAYPPRMRELLARFGFRASLAIPLLREDRIIGALVVRRKSTGEFRPEVVELLKTFATQSALAIQNARLFREIEDKGRQIEAANRHKSEFLANMSHELRTPLNAIIGFSEVLLDPSLKVTEEDQAQFLTDVLSSGKHLLGLINEILDLAKIEAGKMELQIEPALLSDILESVQNTMRSLAVKKTINLHVESGELPEPFPMDGARVKQVLLNLVGNAVKFTSEGGRVWVRADSENGVVRIEVGDTGPGIPAEDHERIFLEFQQAGSEAGKPQGTGLGLALARKFVEMHKGKLWVESEVGKGSRFFFTIPVS